MKRTIYKTASKSDTRETKTKPGETAFERGVPIPKEGHRGRPRYHLGEMSVGESSFVECKTGESVATLQTRVCASVWHYRPKRFTTRRVVEKDGATGVRVWRIK